jgi:hypothetical protein
MTTSDKVSAADAQLAADRQEWRVSSREDLIGDYTRPYPDAARQAWVRRQLERWFAARERS